MGEVSTGVRNAKERDDMHESRAWGYTSDPKGRGLAEQAGQPDPHCGPRCGHRPGTARASAPRGTSWRAITIYDVMIDALRAVHPAGFPRA